MHNFWQIFGLDLFIILIQSYIIAWAFDSIDESAQRRQFQEDLEGTQHYTVFSHTLE